MSAAVNVVCRGGCGALGARGDARWTWADDCGDARAEGDARWPWCPACLPAVRAASARRDGLRLARVLMGEGV